MNTPNTSWIELHQPAFEHNVRSLKNIIGSSSNLSVVIKGNAYGHGLAPVAQLCQQSTYVDWLCAISLTEALELRAYGVTKPILVLSFIDADPALAMQHGIDLMVQDLATAQWLHEQARSVNKRMRIHIKIDTGMSRLGFTPDNAIAAIRSLSALPSLNIVGIATHFANTSNPASEQTILQTRLFNTLIDTLEHEGINIPLKHAANSAATLNHPGTRHNFVRIGAAAYGVLQGQTPIATWKTTISFMREIDANCFVGYDNTYKTTRKTKIAIIPVGYFHGYNRRLSNVGTVLVCSAADNSRVYAPVIGRICMNHTLIDVTHVPNASINDVVILLGPQTHVHPHDIAHAMQSFNPREITTLLNGSIPRTITY